MLIAFTVFCVAVGYLRPRPSGIWIAALAWPVAEWFGLMPGRTNPPGLLVLPAAFGALSAYAGLLVRRRAALMR